MSEETQEKFYQPGTRAIQGNSYLAEKGTIRAYHHENKKYLFEFDDQKREPRWYAIEDLTILPKVEIKNFVRQAYVIWVVGAFLSLLGIFVGQYLGDLYKEPIVYYAVSGTWAFIMGGTSAAIGFVYIAKSKFG